LETAVATLLLVVASVVLACVVVTYAVNTVEQTINTQNIPQLNQLKNFENSILNQTNVMDGTLPQMPSPTP
jgi:predicted PurR-regulated permease PerM